jgi:hypothetical protein
VDHANPEPVAGIRPPGKRGVLQAAWSPVREGVLALIQADDPCVSLWDVRQAWASPGGALFQSPYHVRSASAAPLSMSWQPSTAMRSPPVEEAAGEGWLDDVIDLAVPNRLLVATRAGFEEVSVHEYKPLAISKRGEVLLGCGRVLLTHNLAAYARHDAAVVMHDRTLAAYSMDVGKNLQVRHGQGAWSSVAMPLPSLHHCHPRKCAYM